MFKHIKDSKGFSLVELMVVIAIIGILTAIAIPSYQGYVNSAKRSGAKASLSNVYTLVKLSEAEDKVLNLSTVTLPNGYDAIGFDSYLGASTNGNRFVGTASKLTDCDHTSATANWTAGANSSESNDQDVHVNQNRQFGEGIGKCDDDSGVAKSACGTGSNTGAWIEESCPDKN